jgi:addiction module HigA family antidote
MVRIPTHQAPTHPGEMLLEEFLRPLAITQVAFAEQIGVSLQRLNELVKGKRGVTPDTALRLAQALGTSAELWLNLQLAWDLFHAQHSPAAAEIRRIRPVAALQHVAVAAARG